MARTYIAAAAARIWKIDIKATTNERPLLNVNTMPVKYHTDAKRHAKDGRGPHHAPKYATPIVMKMMKLTVWASNAALCIKKSIFCVCCFGEERFWLKTGLRNLFISFQKGVGNSESTKGLRNVLIKDWS